MWKKPENSEVAAPDKGAPGGKVSTFPGAAARPASGGAAIGPTINIKGDINGSEQLVIHGKVEGSISIKDNDVIIGPKGRVNTKAFARTIRIEGDAQGEFKASELVTLKNTSRVYGSIVTPRIVIEDGCKFKGSIDTDGEARGGAKPEDKIPPRRDGAGNP